MSLFGSQRNDGTVPVVYTMRNAKTKRKGDSDMSNEEYRRKRRYKAKGANDVVADRDERRC